MIKIAFVLLLIFSMLNCNSQENLVPNSGFEDLPEPGFVVSNTNPSIPCRRGEIEDSGLSNWSSFGHPSFSNNYFGPTLFDSRSDCNANYCNSFPCGYYNGEERVGIPNNYYENNPGNGNWVSQNHRKTIDWQTGGTIVGRYIGLQDRLGFNPGVYCKLKKPLKCGYTYTLRFYAVKKTPGGGSDKLQIRFCKSDDWNDYAYLDGDLNKKELHSWITENGGTNHNEWEEETFTFYVDEPNVEYLFIRAGIGNTKVLLDDFEILDQCSIDFACDPTLYAETDEITCNNTHNIANPLTFTNTESSKTFKLLIFPLGQYTPVRTLEITDPGPTIAWDGKNDFGVEVANTYYNYELYYGSACSCRKLVGNFIKSDSPSILIITGTDQNYGVFSLHNLDDVHTLKLKIYNLNAQLVYSKILYNPPSSIYWNGCDDLGYPLGSSNILGCNNPTEFVYEIEVSNNCVTSIYGDNFSQSCFGNNPNIPFSNFEYNQSSKPLIDCEFSYDYTTYAKAPIPCCDAKQDLFIKDVYISGAQEFKLNHDIQAGPKVVVKTNSNILFQAGNEIRLVLDFYTEPGAEFLAKIEPCTRMMVDNGPVQIIQWNNFPDVTIENTVAKAELDSTQNLNVFPNPTTEDLFVQSSKEIYSIDIFDLTGKLVSNEYDLKNNLVKINTSKLLNGVYILQITMMDESVEIRKVIKN